VVLGMAIGFQATMLVANAIYAAAFLAVAGLRQTVVDQTPRGAPSFAALTYAGETTP
jgi:hypothetical protein